MATSGSYSFSVQATDIVREAMLNIGKLGEAEVPTAQEYSDCLRKLNMLAKQWMAKQDFAPGLKMWKRRHGAMFLSMSQFQYNLGPNGNWTNQYWMAQTTATAVTNATTISVPNATIHVNDYVGIVLDSGVLYWTTVSSLVGGTQITIPASGIPSQASTGAYVFNYTIIAQRPEIIEAVVLRDNTGADIPIKILALQDYSLLSSKQQPQNLSDPSYIYYESQLTNGQLYIDVYGAQDTTKLLWIDYMEAVQDFVNPTDNPDYPQRWYLALSWGLTKQIGPMFNLPFSKDMQDNLNDSLQIAREPDSDVNNIFFQPGVD